MSILRDCAFLNARGVMKPVNMHERVPDRPFRHRSKMGEPPYRGQTFERCPTCGGMVIMPCVLCNLEDSQC